MICPNCSAENVAGAPVCVRCGTVLAAQSGPPPPPLPSPGGPAFPPPEEPSVEPGTEARSARPPLILAAVSVLVVAIALIVAAVLGE